MRRLLALAIAVAVAPGCSFVLTSNPIAPTPGVVYPECTTTMGWPIVDAVVGGLMVAAALAAAVDEDAPDEKDERGAIAASLIIGGTFGVSSYVGYQRVSRCRRARGQYMASPQPQPEPAYPAAPPEHPPAAPVIPPPAPPPSPPAATPEPGASALGTEGDVCMRTDECSAGLTCSGNVCMRPQRRR